MDPTEDAEWSEEDEKIVNAFDGEELTGQLRKVDPNEGGSLDHFPFLGWYVDLVEVPDGDKLEDEVSMDPTEDAEWAEEDEKMVNAFDEVGEIRDCLYIS